MSEPPVIAARGVYLQHQDHLAYGPLDFALDGGQGALICVRDLDLLRRLMRCLEGTEPPEAGRFQWWPGARPAEASYGQRFEFYRQIGYIDRQCQLLGALTLLEHLLLYYRYAGLSDGPDRARRILEEFGLLDFEHQRLDRLPEPQRRLALYAQALAKEPRLLLMERPAQFLDRDFDQVWDRVLHRAASGETAYIVFDRSPAPYAPEDFHLSLTLSLGRI